MRTGDKSERREAEESCCSAASDLSAAAPARGAEEATIQQARPVRGRPWTVIYGSALDVLMDWARGADPFQVRGPHNRDG